MKNMIYCSDLAYPPICVAGKNRIYAQAMLSNMGGSNSEISAVSLYFYNSLVACAYKDIAEIFHHISIVEMHHLEIFGKLAKQLGADPRLWSQINRRMVYWTPQYNNYPTQLRMLLMNALYGEQKAVEKYTTQARRIKDENIVENLKRIIADEEIHIDIFKELLSCDKFV